MGRIKGSLWISVLLLAGACGAQESEQIRVEGLNRTVQVHYDQYDIPHIYAQSWTDAYRVLGYLHATERLWQMDMFRRRASGRVAEILGREALSEDILVRRLGIRRGCEALWNRGELPSAVRAEFEAYAAGVNAKLAELTPETLPVYFQQLGYEPELWTPVDCLVFLKYMGWDQSGTEDDLWFGTLAEQLGAEIVEGLWPLDRPYEVPAVKVQGAHPASARGALDPVPGASPAYAAALGEFPAERWLGDTAVFGSNNWAVSGDKTRSGKPILCNDPHLGFQLPSIWYAWHVSVQGENIVGVGFAGCPLVIIGHNDHVGWGMTNLQADAVDYYVETVDPTDPLLYLHEGEWKQMERITEEIPVRGEAPHVVHIDSTVHGPVITREGRTITMQWTGLGPTSESHAIWRMGRARNVTEFLAGMADIIVPGLNLVYADVEGNVALCCCGRYPLRMPGQGRIPMDGASGANDWRGMIPASSMPLAVNPAEGYVASANGRPAAVGYPHYLGWMWDPSYRVRRIQSMLSEAGDLTIDSMKPIQNDAYDQAAERFLPVMLAAVRSTSIEDEFSRNVIEALSRWDYVADLEALGPVFWLRWFDLYRKAVWDDEWHHWGLERQRGSWGFTGDNRREPALEILEYLTLEYPDAVWFDDKETAEIETRDDCIRKSFSQAVTSLKGQFGEDLTAYAWKNFNTLRIRSLAGTEELSRTGGPIPGDSFTVNPGGDIGPVGGGASWRMIVDFGDPASSVGVYPGGQSELPTSAHYDDLMPVWAKGEYVALHMASSPEALPQEAKTRTVAFSP